jgi:hypothetical protein
VEQEQNMNIIFNKLNFITSKSDGKIIDNQNRIYNIAGTTEVSPQSTNVVDTYAELWADYSEVGKKLIEFNSIMVDNKVITDKYTEPGGFTPETNVLSLIEDRRMFMVMARVFEDKNKLKDFQDKIISGEVLKVKKLSFLKRKFNSICDDFRDIVKDELKAEEKLIVGVKKLDRYKKFLDKSTYVKGKMRKFTYTTVPDDTKIALQTKMLTELYSTKNSNDDKTTFNGKVQFN